MLHSVPSDSFCPRLSRLSPGELPTASDNVEVLANRAAVGAVISVSIMNSTILGVEDGRDARLDMPNREALFIPHGHGPEAPEPDLDEVVAHVDASGLAKRSVVKSIPVCQSIAGVAVHEAVVTEELDLGSRKVKMGTTHLQGLYAQCDAQHDSAAGCHVAVLVRDRKMRRIDFREPP